MNLTTKERAVVIAHRHDGVSLTEIAKCMGITQQAVSRIYCRAKVKIEEMGITLVKLDRNFQSGRTITTYDPKILEATIC